MKIVNLFNFLYINLKIVIKKTYKVVFNSNIFLKQKNLIEVQKLICFYKENND